MPVPAGLISLEKNSRAFFCLWWTANQSTASLQPCRQTVTHPSKWLREYFMLLLLYGILFYWPLFIQVKQLIEIQATNKTKEGHAVQWVTFGKQSEGKWKKTSCNCKLSQWLSAAFQKALWTPQSEPRQTASRAAVGCSRWQGHRRKKLFLPNSVETGGATRAMQSWQMR